MTGMILLTVFLTLLLAGFGLGLQAGTRREILLRQQAVDWPKAVGVVERSEVEEKTWRRWRRGIGVSFRTLSSITTFKPVITYTYQVGSQTYQGLSYKNGWLNHASEWVSYSPQNVKRIIAEYPIGKSVNVIYNPANPAQAYLELDTSLARPRLRRVSGFLLITAAIGLLGLGGYRIGQEWVKQQQDSRIAAVIPAHTQSIKNSLEQELGMLCQSSKASGEAFSYTRWECSADANGVKSFVNIYSRQRAPESVDYLSAQTGNSDVEQNLAYWTKVVGLAIPSAEAQEVQAWLKQAQPTLAEQGSFAETTIGGVIVSLENPYGLGLILKIGIVK